MNESDYIELSCSLPNDQIVCFFGKTRVYDYRDSLLVVSNENKHIAVLDKNDVIIDKIMELKDAGCMLPYYVCAKNDKFCFLDEERHIIYKLSWLAFAIYKGGAFDENINNIRKGRIVFKRKNATWDLRKCNLSFSKSKNPKIRVNAISSKDITAIGGIIAPDEEFRPIKGESAVWISNYGRVLSKRKSKPRLLQPILNRSKNPDANQYWRLHLPQTVRGKRVKHCYYIHRLVAETFLDVPEWIKENELLDVHHIRKIKGNENDPMINSYKNLMFVPRKIHAAVDSISEIAVKINGLWKKMDFIQASEYYGLTPYSFMEAIGNEKYKVPDRIWGKYQYYHSAVVADDGSSVLIDVRIIRTRDNKDN